MTNQPNSYAGNFKARDAASYDPVVAEFDHYTNHLLLPLALRLIDLARLSPTDHVLDVGTGTGIVALQIARRGGQRILGIDLSEGMIKAASAHAAQAALDAQLEFQRMDAEALELTDGSFDAVLSMFALLHFPNPLTALQEMFRILGPGGKLALAVGSRPPLLSRQGLAHGLSRLPDLWRLGRGRQLTAPAALNHLVEKHFSEANEPEESHLASHRLNRTSSVVDLVRRAGFVKIQTDWVGKQLQVDSPEEFWAMQRTFSSIARKRLEQATPAKIARLKEEFLQSCHDVQQRNGRLIYPMAAFYVTAQRQ